MSKFTIVGLDCEMTGGHFESAYKTCQVGIAYAAENFFVSDVGWRGSEYEHTAEALLVNKFTHERIQNGPSPDVVERKSVAWVNTVNPAPGLLLAVGWGVHGDLRFVRRDLPALGERFAWRCVDLTSVCTFLGNMRGRYGEYSATTWKQKAKKFAVDKLKKYNIEKNFHDAGYDALVALYGYEWLRSVVRIQD
jgi:oligoribonuclease (3'-5' exoribonuclease)